MIRVENNQTAIVSEKIAKICVNLQPSQILEYDPESDMVTITSESLVPLQAVNQIFNIVASRRANARLLVSRVGDSYKIVTTTQVQL